MTIDTKIKKTVIDLINKERDVSVNSLPNQLDMSVQDHLKKSKELLDDTKKEIDKGIKNGKSVMMVVVTY